MRDRKTIEKSVEWIASAYPSSETEETITIELLLDIRDLLMLKAKV